MLQLLWAPPGAETQAAVLGRLRAEDRPLYLPASLPLLRQTLRALTRQVDARVFADFLERTFAAHHRDWRAISPMEQRIIISHLLRTLDLPELHPIQAKPGMVRAAQRLIRELKEAGIARTDWPEALSHGKGPAFARLAEAYQTVLESRRLADPDDVQRMAAEALQQNGITEKPSLVVVEGFATLNALERGAIEALSPHMPVLLIVTYDPARPALFAPTLTSLGAWWKGATPLPGAPPRPAGIAALQDHLFASHSGATQNRAAVHFTEAPDPAREIAAVARTIKQLLLDKRYRPDEIAIVSNRPDRDRELVRRTMESYGLPVALPPESLISAPVVQALLGLVRGDADACQSPYLPADAAVDLNGQAPVEGHCGALARALPALGVENRIVELIHAHGLSAESAALGARELAAYRAFLRTLVRLEQTYRQSELPAPVGRAEFADLLASELAEATYRTQVRRPGPAVRFLVPAQMEGLRIPVIFAVGLSEGEFPAARSEDWILPDRRRKALEGMGRLVTRTDHRQVERLQFLRVVRAAAAELYLSRSTAGADGSATLPSTFWEEAMACVGVSKPDRKLSGAEVSPGHFDRISSGDELLQRMVQVLRHGSADPQEVAVAVELAAPGRIPGLAPAEKTSLDGRISAEDQRRSHEYSPWDGRLTDAAVTAQLGARFGGEHRFSASELETYAACPFRYLGERVLTIREAEEDGPDLDAAEVGSALHRILAAFYRTPGLDILTQAAEQRLEAIIRQETAGLIGGLGPALQEAWRRQLRRQVMAWLEAERATKRQAQAGAPPAEQLTPAYLEWSFGQKVRPGCDAASTTEPLVLTAGGREYRVAGVVDRIDVDQEGGYTVYDYKSGKSPSGSEITGTRTRLQIPLYLLAARRLGLKGAVRPIGGAYYGLKDRKRSGGIWRKSKKAVHGVNARTLLEDDQFDQTLTELEAHAVTLIANLTGGDMTVNPRVKCPAYCPMRTACRFDEARLEAKAGRAGKEGDGQ